MTRPTRYDMQRAAGDHSLESWKFFFPLRGAEAPAALAAQALGVDQAAFEASFPNTAGTMNAVNAAVATMAREPAPDANPAGRASGGRLADPLLGQAAQLPVHGPIALLLRAGGISISGCLLLARLGLHAVQTDPAIGAGTLVDMEPDEKGKGVGAIVLSLPLGRIATLEAAVYPDERGRQVSIWMGQAPLLPQTLVPSLVGRPVEALLDHPVLSALNLRIGSIAQTDREGLVIGLETDPGDWISLAQAELVDLTRLDTNTRTEDP